MAYSRVRLAGGEALHGLGVADVEDAGVLGDAGPGGRAVGQAVGEAVVEGTQLQQAGEARRARPRRRRVQPRQCRASRASLPGRGNVTLVLSSGTTG